MFVLILRNLGRYLTCSISQAQLKGKGNMECWPWCSRRRALIRLEQAGEREKEKKKSIKIASSPDPQNIFSSLTTTNRQSQQFQSPALNNMKFSFAAVLGLLAFAQAAPNAFPEVLEATTAEVEARAEITAFTLNEAEGEPIPFVSLLNLLEPLARRHQHEHEQMTNRER